MQFIRRHWYSLGLVPAAAAIAWGFWGHLGTIQFILLLNFAALMLHQFEEYAWPGGEPWIINEVMQPKGNRPDRYPLNQNNAFVINVYMAWAFYLVPVFFPGLIWLGLATVLFGISQFFMHGIANNRKLHTLYNPGLAAVTLGHIPLGAWYLFEVYSKSLITLWDWVFAVVAIGVFIGVGMLKIGYGVLASEDSPYPFAREELERFDRSGHLERIRKADAGANAAA